MRPSRRTASPVTGSTGGGEEASSAYRCGGSAGWERSRGDRASLLPVYPGRRRCADQAPTGRIVSSGVASVSYANKAHRPAKVRRAHGLRRWAPRGPAAAERFTRRRDLCGAEQRSLGVGARSALRTSDSRRMFERSERSSRSEFRRATPRRAAQGSRRAAPTAAAGAAPSAAPPARARCRQRGSAEARRPPPPPRGRRPRTRRRWNEEHAPHVRSAGSRRGRRPAAAARAAASRPAATAACSWRSAGTTASPGTRRRSPAARAARSIA